MRKLAVGVLVFGAVLSSAPSLLSQAQRITLFDGATLKGWNGNPAFWSVLDRAIHGVTDKTSGELILIDGDYADFRLILKSRLVSEAI